MIYEAFRLGKCYQNIVNNKTFRKIVISIIIILLKAKE